MKSIWRICNTVFLFMATFLLLAPSVFADVIDDPAGALNPPQETVTSPADQRYTAEAFAALSDDEKKNVYFNTPQMLPENFSPEPYMNIFYPQP